MLPTGRHFYKMSGSGNDFVVVDARHSPPGSLTEPAVVRAVCARGTGVGADGIVFLEHSPSATIKMRYINSDGSDAALCGNASLCTARLLVELGIASPDGFTVESNAGVLVARVASGVPEIDLQPVTEIHDSVAAGPLVPGERKIGYALAGVPHLVVLCDEVDSVDVVGRGRPLRHLRTLDRGANVNFVSGGGEWRIRTYERGVEAETLACGTGAVAAAIMLHRWHVADGPTVLRTRSGRALTVRLTQDVDTWRASLSGEARVVFAGNLGEY
jgi:diaminopimelate epimerase